MVLGLWIEAKMAARPCSRIVAGSCPSCAGGKTRSVIYPDRILVWRKDIF